MSEEKEEVIKLGAQKILDVVFLDEIRRAIKDGFAQLPKAPEGIADSATVSVPDSLKRYPFTQPQFWVNIVNDGPNEVYYALNRMGIGSAKLIPGDNITIDLHGPKIESLSFQCDKGSNASVRLFMLR